MLAASAAMAQVFSPDSTVVTLPAAANGVLPSSLNTPQVRKLHYGDVGYMCSGAFSGLQQLEEVIFEGMVGHIDGYTFKDCPQLRRIIFRGPVGTTGGPIFAENCPMLEEVRFEGLVTWLGFVQWDNCPKLERVTATGGVVESGDTAMVANTTAAELKSNPAMHPQVGQLLEWQSRMLDSSNTDAFLRRLSYLASPSLMNIASEAGIEGLQNIMEQIEGRLAELGRADEFRSKLEILKDSPAYESQPDVTVSFSYAPATDSLLALSRKQFNLDSIAGTGTDVERIKNLLYWVHDLVPHDGGSTWPNCNYNLRELAQVCRDGNRGVNCRMMAIMLTEALLAQGIPARYITCQSKQWDTDPDCHVICVAWSRELGKWVWVDPTFAAWVTDENGLMLHPGEVRYRLQHDLPLVLNDDANWNHKQAATKEDYLERYMAKNLYLLSANSQQQAEPEGRSTHKQGHEVTLVPAGFTMQGTSSTVIHDEQQFWQAPARQ